MTERAVINSNWTNAHSLIANEHISVTTVGGSTLLPDVVLVANHPDQAWCTNLFHSIECSVEIGFEGERTSMVSDNCKSV